MLEGRESPDKALLKEGSGTDDHTSIRRRPQVPLKTSPGEEETRGRKRLPTTVTISSRVLMMLLCCVCTLPLLLAICALTEFLDGHFQRGPRVGRSPEEQGWNPLGERDRLQQQLVRVCHFFNMTIVFVSRLAETYNSEIWVCNEHQDRLS
ncbi:hypothetical protein NDU88_004946 [Pleurodeles waltl]|uniref:Uncharacterized protein n=1 Tax=Pleurodeles waltl TaxID=8319 RepID=A0AAV7V2L1_PLEWA|nr:hypothetical protein NDU88_004946 [Pleurodeles waltl]